MIDSAHPGLKKHRMTTSTVVFMIFCLGAGLGYSTLFVVSGSMALVAMVLYMGVFFYMHRRQSVLAEAT